jgi:hypothetical protein
LLGLALCVFAWGLQYKLSLYDPPQAASHQIPTAKLLSKNELSSTTDILRVVRTRTTARMIYTVSTSIFPLLALSLLLLQEPHPTERAANRSWHLPRRAFLNALFDRPPPALI